MKDVFISKHNDSSMHWTEQIAKELESRGISVWYSPRDVLSDYPTDIVKAIRQCKVFLFLFNEYSNMSEHCKNEISIAFDRYRLHDGISLLSFKTSNQDPSEDIYYYLTRIHAVDGTLPPEVKRVHELCDRISVLLDMTPEQKKRLHKDSLNTEQPSEILKKEYALKGDFVYPDKKFMGRENELKQIHEFLTGRINKLMITGMGGIGKTELAKQYAHVYGEEYDIIIKLDFTKSIREMIVDDTNLMIDGCSKEEYTGEKEDQYFLHKLNILKKLSDRKTLIIVDNFDVMEDPDLDTFCNGEYTVLFTTRTQELSPSVPEYVLEPFHEEEELLKLFRLEYKRAMTRVEEEIILKMISHFQKHTLLIRLFGNAMQKNRITPGKIQQEGDNYLPWMNVKTAPNKTVLDYLKDFVHISSLTEEENDILCNMVLVPNGGMETSEFAEACGIEGFDDIDNLIRGNWIIHEPAEDHIHLHPMIREVFMEQIRRNPKICETFVQSMTDRCAYTHSRPWKEKVELYNLMSSICETLPKESALYFQSEYACAMMNMDMANYTKAAAILEEMMGQTQWPAHRCRLWNKLAQIYALKGNVDRAEATAKEGCNQIRSYSAEDVDESVRLYHLRSLLERLSETSRKKNQYDQSIEYAKEAVEISEILEGTTGERSLGWSLYHLASSYVARGGEDALTCAELTLQRAVTRFLDVNDEGAVLYCNQVQGQILVKKNCFEEAIALFDLVYKGFVERFGEEHPDVANVYVDYGICYSAMKQNEKAEEYYLLAENIYEAHQMREKLDYVRYLKN